MVKSSNARSGTAVALSRWRTRNGGASFFSALYTGQRLGDLGRLIWQNIGLERRELRLVTSKTGRQQIIWMAEPLMSLLANVPAGDNPKQPIHPRAFASVTKSGKVGTLLAAILRVDGKRRLGGGKEASGRSD